MEKKKNPFPHQFNFEQVLIPTNVCRKQTLAHKRIHSKTKHQKIATFTYQSLATILLETGDVLQLYLHSGIVCHDKIKAVLSSSDRNLEKNIVSLCLSIFVVTRLQ